MLYHYLLIAFRSFLRHRSYSILNILGLTLGVVCSLVIFLYVFDELSYDHNHKDASNIYRLSGAYHLPNNGGMEQYATSPAPVGEAMLDFPEVKQVVRVRRIQNVVMLKPGTDERNYEVVFAVDSNLFDVFTFPFVAGNPENAINDVHTVVISERTARRYFNRTDVVGESMRLPDDSIDLKITGVIENPPANSHLKPDIIISIETSRAGFHFNMQTWWNFAFHTYIQMAPQSDAAGLEEKIKFISRKYIPDQEDGSGYHQEYSLTPMSQIHLHSALRSEMEANNKASYVYIFLIVGVFILVIACINFMNLATARSAARAKEIGMRKVAGAVRRELIRQFLGESFLMTIIAVSLAVVSAFLVLPHVNDMTGKEMELFSQKFFWVALAVITIFVSLLAGSYPSLVLSSFRPVEVLKGNFRSSSKGNALRKALVIFQFSISIFLIAGTLVIMSHMNFLRSVDLGFEKESQLFIPTRGTQNAARDFKTLKDEMLKVSGVSLATLSSHVPGKEMNNNVVRIGWDENAAWSDMRYLTVDADFVKTYDLEMVEGRSFSEEVPSDENEAFLLNESGTRRLGFKSPKEAIGQKLGWSNRKGYVIGVLRDFHFMSTNTGIEPFIVVMNSQRGVGYLTLKIGGDLQKDLEQIEQVFHQTLPGRIFEYSFLDEDFDKQYKSEERFMRVYTAFAIVAILIACLGLYGLAMYMSEFRFREVGIRKVLGASERSLLNLLTRDFMLLVVIAVVFSIPVSYWAMEKWLSSFPYRESMNPLLFGAAGLIALAIALATVSYQAWKAARTNPVKSISAH